MIRSTAIYEAKATSYDVVEDASESFKRQMAIVNFDLPTLDLSDIPNYKKYVENFITSYDAYLGYPSNVTYNDIKTMFNANLKVFCAFLMLKRKFDSKNWKGPSGHRVKNILGNVVKTGTSEGSETMLAHVSRFNAMDNISNDMWTNNYVPPFTEVCLPAPIMAFYDYYISNYFDITSLEDREGSALLTFWPEMDSLFTLSVDADDPNILFSSTKWTTLVSDQDSINSSKLKTFVKNYLGWSSPTKDVTRDKQGNSVTILRDESLIDMLCNIYPEEALAIVGSSYIIDENPSNITVPYYYDFEQIYKFKESETEELIADSFFFNLSLKDTSPNLFIHNEESDSIILNYNYMLLLSLLNINEENLHSGGVLGVYTKVDLVKGTLITANDKEFIFTVGSDIELKFTEVDGSPISTAELPMKYFAPVLNQYNEMAENKTLMAIFRYPMRMGEGWIVKGSFVDIPNPVTINITIFPYRGTVGSTTYKNEFWKGTRNLLYKMDASEVLTACSSVCFRMVSIYYNSLSEANAKINELFDNKQQQSM